MALQAFRFSKETQKERETRLSPHVAVRNAILIRLLNTDQS